MTRCNALVLAVLVACGLAPMPPTQRYSAMCDSWLQSNISQVVLAWGQPTSSTRLPDGTVMYEWDTVEGTNMPPDRLDHFSREQERGVAWCSTRFVTAADGRITSYKWNGNDYNDGINFRVGCYTQYMPPAAAPPR
jgi:hypothetical protein